MTGRNKTSYFAGRTFDFYRTMRLSRSQGLQKETRQLHVTLNKETHDQPRKYRHSRSYNYESKEILFSRFWRSILTQNSWGWGTKSGKRQSTALVGVI